MKKYVKSGSAIRLPKVVDVSPCYAGGGWYLFWGAFSDGTYFMGNYPYWDLRVVDSDPRTTDNGDDYDAVYPDWQEAHLVRDIDNNKTKAFYKEVFDWVLKNNPDNHFCNYNSGDIEELVVKNDKRGNANG